MFSQLTKEKSVNGTGKMLQALQRLESLDYSPSKWPQVKAHLNQIACFKGELVQQAELNGSANVPSELDQVIDGRMPVEKFGPTMRTWRLSPDAAIVEKYTLCLNAFLDELKEFQKLPPAAAALIGRIIGNLLKNNAVSDELAFVLKLMLSDWLRDVGAPAFNATMSALLELGDEYLRHDHMLSHRLRHSPGYPFLPTILADAVNKADDHHQPGQQPHMLTTAASQSALSAMNGIHKDSDAGLRTSASDAALVTHHTAAPVSTTSLAINSLFDRLTTRAQAGATLEKSTSQQQTLQKKSTIQNQIASQQSDLEDILYTTEWLLPIDISDDSVNKINDVNRVALTTAIHDSIGVLDPNRDAADKILFICNQMNESMVQQHGPMIMRVCNEQVQRKYNGQKGEFILWLAWYITLERARVEENYHELYLNILIKLSASGLKTILPACVNMCAYFLVLALDLSHDMLQPRLDLKGDAAKLALFLGLIVAHRKSGTSIPDFLEPCRLIETMRQVSDRVANSNDVRRTVRFTETILAVACGMLKRAHVPATNNNNNKGYSNGRQNAAPPPTDYLLRQLRYLRRYHETCHEQARFEIERLFEALHIKLNDAVLLDRAGNNTAEQEIRIITRTDLPQIDAKEKPSPPRPASSKASLLPNGGLNGPGNIGSLELLSPADFSSDGVFDPRNAQSGVFEHGGVKPLPAVHVEIINKVVAAAAHENTARNQDFMNASIVPVVNGESSFYVTMTGDDNHATFRSRSPTPNVTAAGDVPQAHSGFMQKQQSDPHHFAQHTPPASGNVDPAIISSGTRSGDQTPTTSTPSSVFGINTMKSVDPAVEDAVILNSPSSQQIRPIAPPGGRSDLFNALPTSAADYESSIGGAPGPLGSSAMDPTAAAHEQQLQQHNLPELAVKLLELSSEGDAAIASSANHQRLVPTAIMDAAVTVHSVTPQQRRLPVFLHGDDIWWDVEELRNVYPLRPGSGPLGRLMAPPYRWDLGMNMQPGSGIDEHWLRGALCLVLESLSKTSTVLCLLRERLMFDHSRKGDLWQLLLQKLEMRAREDANLFKARVPIIIAPTVALITCKDFAFDVNPMHMQVNGDMNARYLSSALIDCMFRSKLRQHLRETLYRLIVTTCFDTMLSPESRQVLPRDMRTELEGTATCMTDEVGAVIVQYIQYKAIRYSILELNATQMFQEQIMQRRHSVLMCNNDVSAAAGAHLAKRMEHFQAVNAKLPLRLRYRLDGMPPPELTGPYNVIRRRVHGFTNNQDFVTRRPLPP